MLQNPSSKSYRAIFGHLLRTTGACGAVCASMFVGSLNGWTAGTEINAQERFVNREHKGDRLPPVLTFDLHADQQAQIRNLPDGCESAVSPIVDKQLARIAIRCIS